MGQTDFKMCSTVMKQQRSSLRNVCGARTRFTTASSGVVIKENSSAWDNTLADGKWTDGTYLSEHTHPEHQQQEQN